MSLARWTLECIERLLENVPDATELRIREQAREFIEQHTHPKAPVKYSGSIESAERAVDTFLRGLRAGRAGN